MNGVWYLDLDLNNGTGILYTRMGHKNHFPSLNSVPAVFGCQMVQAFQKYQAFCHTTSHRWCDIYFSPKNPKEGPLSKKNNFYYET